MTDQYEISLWSPQGPVTLLAEDERSVRITAVQITGRHFHRHLRFERL